MTGLPATIHALIAEIDDTHGAGLMIARDTITDSQEWVERVLATALATDLIVDRISSDGRWVTLKILPPGEELLADAAKPKEATPMRQPSPKALEIATRYGHPMSVNTLAAAIDALINREWNLIAANPPPPTDMIIWGYEREPGKWSIGLAYPNVVGGWSDGGGFQFDWTRATHWARMPEPPTASKPVPNV
jgi:hypothetical protein